MVREDPLFDYLPEARADLAILRQGIADARAHITQSQAAVADSYAILSEHDEYGDRGVFRPWPIERDWNDRPLASVGSKS
jgi:hypothetical protein